jgi:hypothetical protein
MEPLIPRHIRLSSHPGGLGQVIVPIHWGAATAPERGPVVASPAEPRHRNAIGSYSGSYAIYRALAVATLALSGDHRPDLTDTAPVVAVPPRPQWADPAKIVSLDPWGHRCATDDRDHQGAHQPAGNSAALRQQRAEAGRSGIAR